MNLCRLCLRHQSVWRRTCDRWANRHGITGLKPQRTGHFSKLADSLSQGDVPPLAVQLPVLIFKCVCVCVSCYVTEGLLRPDVNSFCVCVCTCVAFLCVSVCCDLSYAKYVKKTCTDVTPVSQRVIEFSWIEDFSTLLSAAALSHTNACFGDSPVCKEQS